MNRLLTPSSSSLWRQRSPRWAIGALTATAAAAYFADERLNASTAQRNLRTFYHGLRITAAYKLRFHEGADVAAIHQQAADRILWVCQRNGGLYVKFGQSRGFLCEITCIRFLYDFYDKAWPA